MTVKITATPTTRTRSWGLGTFFGLTFLLTWGIAALFVFTPDLVGPAGLSNPLFVVAVWAPAISGVAVAWNRLGRHGLGGFFRRLTMIRMPARHWAFLVVGIPAIVYSGAFFSGTAGDSPVFSPWYSAIPALVAAMFLAGTLEEIGWRGVALPLLQRRFTPLTSGLLVGLVWALWHLPAFALSGTVQSGWAFPPYFAGLLAVSVIMTWFFNATNGSILVAWLLHFQAMNPLFTDGQPWDSLFYVIAAVIVVIVDRKTMLRRGGDAIVDLQAPSVTEVVEGRMAVPVG